jgi:hypothetical protein
VKKDHSAFQEQLCDLKGIYGGENIHRLVEISTLGLKFQ